MSGERQQHLARPPLTTAQWYVAESIRLGAIAIGLIAEGRTDDADRYSRASAAFAAAAIRERNNG